jgi:hypothetical protein
VYSSQIGTFLQRDPLPAIGNTFVMYSHAAVTRRLRNLYEYVNSSPINATDPSGLDRYITQFDVCGIGDTGGTNIHVGVAVDVYECHNGQFVKTGVKTYDFQVNPTYGLGVIGGIIVWWGQVLPSNGLNLDNPITFKSTPCEDVAMLAELERQVANPLPYSAIGHNCIWWSVGAVNYGMGAQSALDAAICAPPCSCVLDGKLYTFPSP